MYAGPRLGQARGGRRNVQRRSSGCDWLPSRGTRHLGNLFGGGSRVELHRHRPGGIAVARKLLARNEVAVVQGSLDYLRSDRRPVLEAVVGEIRRGREKRGVPRIPSCHGTETREETAARAQAGEEDPLGGR